jgi:hypothetical protein
VTINRFDKYMDEKIHKHLEIDKGDTVLTISVFDTPSTGDIEIDIHRADKQNKLTFNSTKMFLSEEQFKDFTHFFDEVNRQVSIRNSHKFVEELRQERIMSYKKQIDFVQVDDDHIDLKTPNLYREIIDSDTIKSKMRASKDYCKRFYAAMCNTDVYKVGAEGEYGMSWRSAGGLIADILGEGDYLNWYCSGNEGYVDDEIADDLNAIGWVAVPIEPDLSEYKQGNLYD